MHKDNYGSNFLEKSKCTSAICNLQYGRNKFLQIVKRSVRKAECKLSLLWRFCCREDVAEKQLQNFMTDKFNAVKKDKLRGNFELLCLSVKSHDEFM